MKGRILLHFVAGLACLPAALAAQQAPAAVARQLVIEIEDPTDWKPVGTPGTRGIEARARSSILVTGRVKHPVGVADVELMGNRASLVPEAEGWTRFTGYVRILEKTTVAEVTVVLTNGQKVPVKYAITPTAPAPPAASPAEAWVSANEGFTGKRWAVVVGISAYQDTTIVPLKYADRDAKAFYDFLRSPLAGLDGFNAENIQILLNEQATYQNIRVALFDFLKGAAPEDVVYIYFAGHGAPDPQRQNNLYLLPYDANSKKLGGTGIPMEDMQKALRQVDARHKILITDACHSGGISTETRSLSSSAVQAAFLQDMLTSEGVNVSFAAAGRGQLSHEGEQWGGGHGVFTYALLEGLKGSADSDRDLIVSIGEALDYTRARVLKDIPSRAQIPEYTSVSFNYNFPVALVDPSVVVEEVSMSEIAAQHEVNVLMTAAAEAAWMSPDSLVVIAGVPEPVEIRLANEKRDLLPGKALKWSSSNPALATVTEDGVVNATGPGNVTIRAEGRNKSVNVPVRLLPRPQDVAFTPVESEITIVQTEEFAVGTDLVLANGQVLRGVQAKLTHPDSAVLRHIGNGRYLAEREGDVKVTAAIAGRMKEWNVHVIAPLLEITRPGLSVPVGETIQLHASRARPDGSIVGDAVNVTWRSSDTTRATVRNGVLRTHRIGHVTLSGFMGSSEDTTSFYVLGDLLVGVKTKEGQNIASVSIATGEAVLLLEEGIKATQPVLSPRGDRIAFVSENRIFVANTDGSEPRRLTPDMNGLLGVRTSKYWEDSPSWTSDGSRLVFASNAYGNYEILSVRADGTDVQRLTDDSHVDGNVSAAPDVPRIAFERVVAAGDYDLVIALPDGSQQQQFTSAVAPHLVKWGERKPRFLPGGNVLAYVKRLGGSDGEGLSLFDIIQGAPLRDLVPPQKNHEIVYAVAPDGKRLAYHQKAVWGKRNNSIVVIDVEGAVVKTIPLGNNIEIEDLSWGAAPIVIKQEAK